MARFAVISIFALCFVCLAQGRERCQDKDMRMKGKNINGICQSDHCVRGNWNYLNFKTGERLWSKNKKYEFTLQEDGNLVIYCYRSERRLKPVWSSNTYGKKNVMWFTNRGNLLLTDDLEWRPSKMTSKTPYIDIDSSGDYLWDTKTSGSIPHGPCELLLNNDGILALYDEKGKIHWFSDSFGRC